MNSVEGPGSISIWIGKLKRGNLEAVAALFDRYFIKLSRYAERKLNPAAGAPSDGQDVALMAFEGLYRGAVAGKFKTLNNRGDLWRILVVLASRKAAEVCRTETRIKRGGSAKSRLPLNSLESAVPAVDFRLALEEQKQLAMAQLRNDRLREIARLALDGASVGEISARLGILKRTVNRKLELICNKWAQQIQTEQS